MIDKFMRKLPKTALAILLLVFCFFTGIPQVSAAGALDNPYVNPETYNEAMVIDHANLLKDGDEFSRIMEAMKPITQYGNVVFYTTDREDGQSVKERAKYTYEGIYLNTSGTIFMIDMCDREIYIFSHGAVEKVISSSQANIITDNVYTYASKGAYAECGAKAFEQIFTLLEGGRIAAPMKYLGNIFLAFITSIFICYAVLKRTSQTQKALNSELIGGKAHREMIDKKRVLYKQDRSERSSGGGGGGGGGSRGGGGGFSGGSGGGHKF